MTTRRSFLSMLGLAPVAAPAIAEELAKPSLYIPRGVPTDFGSMGELLAGSFDDRDYQGIGAGDGRSLWSSEVWGEPLDLFRNTPRIRASRKHLAGLPERVSRERAKSVRRA